MKKTLLTKNLKAFSLVELSIVIIIVGIIIIGITGGSILIKKSRISAAKSLTQNSAINSIREGILWLETSLNNSFSPDFEVDNNSPLTNDSWSNISQYETGISLNIAGSGDDVIYSNTINHIPAIKFSAGKYLEFDGSFLNGTDYTITILDKRLTADDDNYFIGDSSNTDDNESLLLGYSKTAEVIHSQSGSASDSSYASNIDSYSNSNGKARIFTFIHSKHEGNKTYINGYLAKSDSNLTDHLTNITTLQLGQGYSGEIGEVIFFTKALTNSERRDIEKYLTKKFKAEDSISLSLTGNNSDSQESEGCDGGKISGSGCVQTCLVSETGVSSPSTVESGSGTLTCNEAGYTGTISYTCANTTLSTADSCSCDTGYELEEGECVTAPLTCTGGTVTTSGDYKYHAFTSVGSSAFSCSKSAIIELLVVGGGGAGQGGNWKGGGGGGGGIYHNSAYSFDGESESVTVGTKGYGGAYRLGPDGSPSSFGDITAYGGGGGGKLSDAEWMPRAGSSGGASDNYCTTRPGTQTNQTSGGIGSSYGNIGYCGDNDKYNGSGGGGGGAGEYNDGSTIGVNGGDGQYFANFSDFGENGYFAGGGGGAGNGNGTSGVGGLGGGGGQEQDSSVPNSGGGGGSGSGGTSRGGSGSNGIILIRYDTTQ